MNEYSNKRKVCKEEKKKKIKVQKKKVKSDNKC